MEKVEISELYYMMTRKYKETLIENVKIYTETLEQIDMRINKHQMKTMLISWDEKHPAIKRNGKITAGAEIQILSYSMTILQDGKMNKEVKELAAVDGRLVIVVKNAFIDKR